MITDLSDRPATLEDDLAWCRTVAAKDKSALYQVSRLLSSSHRRLFDVTYTSMRILDDAVDGSDTSPPVAEPMMWLEDWQRAMRGAFAGQIPQNVPEDILRSARAMAPLVRTGQLSVGLWDDLADALRCDITHATMHDWDDFSQYCLGATVAPSAIFVYILTCRFGDDQHHDTPIHDLQRQVTPLATFCYLVHIARDLVEDASKSERLITLPTSFLSAHNTSAEALHEQAEAQPEAAIFEELRTEIVSRARGLLPDCHQSLAEINQFTNWRGRMALHMLFRKYLVLARKLGRN